MDSMVFKDEVTENEIQWQTVVAKQDIRTNFHLLKPVNPLSGKRDTTITCDICQNPATLQCISCHSCWCTHEHFLLDDEPIHVHICSKLTELWYMQFERAHQQIGEDTVSKRMEDRIQTQMILDIKRTCEVRSRGYCAERNYIMALAPALRSLQFALKVCGPQSIEFVSCSLMLARIHLGLRKYNYVNQSLSQLSVECDRQIQKELQNIGEGKIYTNKITNVQTVTGLGQNMIKFPFVRIPLEVLERMDTQVISLQGRVQYLYGTFFQSLGERDLSIKFLSESVYYQSLAEGPTGLKTSLSYLEIAKSLLIGQKPKDLSKLNMKDRFKNLNTQVKQSLNILQITVDIWNTAIRRSLNEQKVMSFDYAEVGEPRLLLQDAKAIAAMYLGMDSFLFIKATSTLCLLFTMYDADYEAVIEARVARRAIAEFQKWVGPSDKEWQDAHTWDTDMRDLMSVLETPEVMRRIAQIERENQGRIII
ncbi:Conserved_hypothetical protein [Hexamita inflata]|uniref:Uncharacterized protein n=1 Tax=Hexamita inflata TaxID=28002 RepID=A0AA86UPD3_9EUKA|nr:Conserved hypothetical protein [Hexamita inflata]CAI9962979.1 Conserved hypothetical protein [Hexamita inflata]